MRLFGLLLASLLCASAASAAPVLEKVLILERHGVRPPTKPPEAFAKYSAEPWPQWSVAPGELTAHGAALIATLGGWYRQWLSRDGLVSAQGCADANRVYIRADVDQRTRESGRAFARGLMPDCPVSVHVESGDVDPLFHPAAAGMVRGDGATAAAAVSGRIGNAPAALAGVYRHQFQTLEEILGKQSVLGLPASVGSTEEGLADIRGPIRTGSTLTENLLLEYAEGMTGKDLGWGRLDPNKLTEILALHTAYADLARRTSYLATVQGSNLLQRILLSLDQAVSRKPVAGALGGPEGRVLVLAGHDTNISHIAGMLNLSWLLPGYQRDDTPPGGSLVFRLWRDRAGAFSADLLFIAQTLDQMHNATPLSLAASPAVAPVFLPGCGADCSWDVFRQNLAWAIDRRFIEAAPPAR